MTLTRTEVRALLDRYGIRPKRSLGQNFVVEPNTVRRIAELAGVGAGDRVVEIGPGVGSLTLALAETGASVTAVEIDDVLVDVTDLNENHDFNSAIEKIDFVVELLPYHLNDSNIPSDPSEVLYKYDIESGKWKLNQVWTGFGGSAERKKFIFTKKGWNVVT